jgi:hypothetical protein
MAYDKKDFVLSTKIKSLGIYGQYSEIIAYNNSSIPIQDVWVKYHIIENGVITQKSTKQTSDIAPGENRQILSENTGNNRIKITEIIVQAADGTRFSAQPPHFSHPILRDLMIIGGILLFAYVVLNIFAIVGNATAIQNASGEDINAQPFEVSRVNSTSVKIVYLGGKYSTSLKTFSVGYTNPDGKKYLTFIGDSNSLLPLSAGTTKYLDHVGSKISVEISGYIKEGFFGDESWHVLYSGNV